MGIGYESFPTELLTLVDNDLSDLLYCIKNLPITNIWNVYRQFENSECIIVWNFSGSICSGNP